jgi:hypothetical protein
MKKSTYRVLKVRVLHDEQIHGPDPGDLVVQESAPGQAWRTSWLPAPVAPNRSGTHDQAELKQLASNPLGAPQWILASHPRDEETDFRR